jgi:exodeoxyribonuclease V alpha subunit
MLKGISKDAANEIIKKYNEDDKIIYEVIEKRPDELLMIKGIGEKKLKQIMISFKEKKEYRELSNILIPLKITNLMITKIFNAYGRRSTLIIKNIPYSLTDINGISFKKADEIALKLGKKKNSKDRLKAAIAYIINNEINLTGDTYFNKKIIYVKYLNLLELKNNEIQMDLFKTMINELKEDNRNKIIELDKKNITLKNMFSKEKFLLKSLNEKISKKPIIDEIALKVFIMMDEKTNNIIYSEQQKNAIKIANKNNHINIICGYAGTGKTTVIKTIINLYKKKIDEKKIISCALSGIATNRIKQATNSEAKTIHSLLEFDGKKWIRNNANKLDYELVIIDECSMISIDLFTRLFKAINFNKTSVILLGDDAQLQPIGNGDFFTDILKYKILDNILLDKIYRQSEDKVITKNAEQIRQNKVPEDNLKKHEDYEFIKSIDIHDDIKNIVKKYKIKLHQCNTFKELNNFTKTFLSNIKILTPTKNNKYGTHQLNKLIQSILNPGNNKDTLIIEKDLEDDKIFKLYDQVIHLRNMEKDIFDINKKIYKNEVNKKTGKKERKEDDKIGFDIKRKTTMKIMNGQIGMILKINKKEKKYFVYYPNENIIVTYTDTDFKENIIDHAYAITVHKSQGSEYNKVIMIFDKSHSFQLNKKIIYTGITRAKEKFYGIGSEEVFRKGCESKKELNRKTIISFELSKNEIK